jgi:hypothetical protein
MSVNFLSISIAAVPPVVVSAVVVMEGEAPVAARLADVGAPLVAQTSNAATRCETLTLIQAVAYPGKLAGLIDSGPSGIAPQ